MATEEQTTINGNRKVNNSGDGGCYASAGQRLTITNRIVSKLSFPLSWLRGSPTGDVNFVIRKVSDDSIIVQKVFGDASIITNYGLPELDEWSEVTFDTPTFINEEVRLLCEVDGGDASHSLVLWFYRDSSVKDDEEDTFYLTAPPYTDDESSEGAYIYTYTLGDLPTVTTQAMSSIVTTTATGNGTITNLGDTDVTQHGHCWNTTGTPTTADSKTENGAPAATGAFTSSMTGLTRGITYYARAYATNSAGTSYGDEVSFVAGGWYRLNIKNISLPYEDLDKTKELHILLKNLSPTAKEAGADGEVVIEVSYEPAA